MNILLSFLIAASYSKEIDDLYESINLIQSNIDQSMIILTSLLEKSQAMSRTSKFISSRSTKIIGKLKQSTDVAIYSLFNAEIARKQKLAESQQRSIAKNLEAGSVTQRIEKVIDFYVKRQQVPDPEMHQNLFQVERKIGEVATLIKNVYNIDWLYVTLILIGLGLGYLWTLVKKAQKKHFL